jgi:hypothetical protein
VEKLKQGKKELHPLNPQSSASAGILGLLRQFQTRTRSVISHTPELAEEMSHAWLDSTGQAIQIHKTAMLRVIDKMKLGRSDREKMLLNEVLLVLAGKRPEKKEADASGEAAKPVGEVG